tara:strand:- start:127 stop:993 length:867 start_codon:yes stop_codon:yes gene_type:complete
MLNGKQVSVNESIRRVFRDSQVQHLSYQDAIEWAVDCIDLIRVPRAYNNDIAMLKVEDYKSKLPCNYRQMQQATGAFSNGVTFPMMYSENTFHPTKTIVNNNINISTQPFAQGAAVVNITNPIGVLANGDPVFNFITSNTINGDSFNKQMFQNQFSNVANRATYQLNEDYIMTSFKEGYALISYLAYPFDCEGFPLIPDDIKFKLAIQWFIQEKLDYMLWRQGKITDKLYEDTRTNKEWYLGAAQHIGVMLNIDQMESLRNTFAKVMVRADWHRKAFSKNTVNNGYSY